MCASGHRSVCLNGFPGTVLVLAMSFSIAGCIPSLRQPDRLVPVSGEVELIRLGQPELSSAYAQAFAGRSHDLARGYRNEIVAQRMYAIDLNYSEYEAALTRERQEIGFSTLTAAEGLNIAGTLVSSAATKGILAGAAGGVLATKGHYESEVVIAKTMQILQSQMRANRQNIAARIMMRMSQDVLDYPLAAAWSDLEDYYRAGTLTSGLLEASTNVSIDERNAQNKKEGAALAPVRTTYVRDANSNALITYLYPNGTFSKARADELQAILRTDMNSNEILARIVEGSYGAVLRADLVRRARGKGVKL